MFKNNDNYLGYEKQTSTRKMLSFFLDYILIAILGIVLSIAGAVPILKNTNVYKDSIQEMETSSVECYKIQCDAKLSIKKDESSILNEDDLFLEYLQSHILLSYSYNTDKYNEASINIDDTSNKATYDNDLIGYYFSNYKLSKNIKVEDYNGKDGKEYFVSLLTNSDAGSYYELHENELPSLKVEVGVDLYKYTNNINKSSEYFSTLKSSFLGLNRKGLIELNEYAPYKTEYDKYINGYETICRAQNVSLVITYSILFVLMIILPKVIFGVTIGGLSTKTRIRYERNRIVANIIDNILTYILMFSSVAFVGLVSFDIASLAIKIFYNITILTFVFVSLIVMIADLILTAFIPRNSTLVELAAFETMVDVHKSIKKEELVDEKDEA